MRSAIVSTARRGRPINRGFESPTEDKPSRPFGRPAKVDAVAHSAMAVRSEAEDSRRSREQCVRARHSNLI
jgi:hypothetical protein